MALAEETVPAGEAELVSLLRQKIVESRPDGRRDAHQKAHGLLKASFNVVPDLPEELRVGLFADPTRSYRAWIRFSNATVHDDEQPDARGMAIKLLGVPGEKILEHENDEKTHDFVLVSHNVFFGADVRKFALIANKKEKGELPGFLSENPRIAAIFAGTLRKFKNLLETDYHSATPYLFGEGRAVKYLLRRQNDNNELQANEADLGSALKADLERQDHVFDFMIQFQKDEHAMPIEDASVAWSEDESPFIKVAKIKIFTQDFDHEKRRALAETISYTPWHCLPEHRPLGGINRARKVIYEAVSIARHDELGEPREEPAADDFDAIP
ncbi:MAG: catalase family protein [Proteobacteria bacterium]|nr:catalase family protein [Pseudomonadota bacterium]